MVSRNFFLNPRMGTDLLLAAAGERVSAPNYYLTKHEHMNNFD
jgi:hypothetical protein